MTLTPLMRKFVLHWGEMGRRWGVNRTVAQVHALLYLSPQPLDAEEIAKTLAVARSNVSASLRELQSWGIVRPVHLLGNRREHFESLSDVWEMARTIVEERKRREIDPTVAMLSECRRELDGSPEADARLRLRIQALLEFLEFVTSMYEGFGKLPREALRSLVMGRKVVTRARAGRRSAT